MNHDGIKAIYFDALRRARDIARKVEESFPDGLDPNDPISIKMHLKKEWTYGGVAALGAVVVPAKDAVFTEGILTEISDEYDNATTKEEEDNALKRFYDLHEIGDYNVNPE